MPRGVRSAIITRWEKLELKVHNEEVDVRRLIRDALRRVFLDVTHKMRRKPEVLR